MSKKESKSQHVLKCHFVAIRCYKYRNVKERKQITTERGVARNYISLLQISQCQRKKANHNTDSGHLWPLRRCYKYRNVKERKQITTKPAPLISESPLLQISQCQRKKANHNRRTTVRIFQMAATNIAMSKKESKSQQP